MRTQNLSLQIQPVEKGFLTMLSSSIRKTFEVHDYILIGRDDSAQIALSDLFMSNRHARIEKRGDGFYVRDLRSRNGTFINGSRILEAKLQDHDRLCVGMTEFIFSSEKDMGISPTFVTSRNTEWNQQLQRLPALAQSPHPILLIGPSGTGKEILASLIHKLSFRSKNTFLSVNCSALTEALAESELFGHTKGSFTGSQGERKGAFETARGGTLFLDEIGDMPLSLQPKFLRALENQEIKPVGSDVTVPTDVRIVAATNRNLMELVASGKFREDLYFRLHVLKIQPPTLSERIEDFDALLQHFAKPLKVQFTIEALVRLKQYDWPGNIRELKNVVSRAAAMFPGRPISEDDVDDIIDNRPKKRDTKSNVPAVISARQIFRDYERSAIVDRLILYEGNQRRVAEDLGIAKSTLHDRIKRYNINPKNLKALEAERKNQTPIPVTDSSQTS